MSVALLTVLLALCIAATDDIHDAREALEGFNKGWKCPQEGNLDLERSLLGWDQAAIDDIHDECETLKDFN